MTLGEDAVVVVLPRHVQWKTVISLNGHTGVIAVQTNVDSKALKVDQERLYQGQPVVEQSALTTLSKLGSAMVVKQLTANWATGQNGAVVQLPVAYQEHSPAPVTE